ncbi:MAG: 3-hydroxyacyl-ACP dehydratase FabZ [Elusimicrobia bacterium]|nr:3-hydroxyacyl-ACP dehydratase FabZ [Elusimicrobiota bacterium]
MVRTVNCEEILRTIPHRYPFLLIDKVEVIEENKKCVGIKCVTANELFFHGHFPQKPVMPGVLIIEAMAQTAAAMMMSLPETKGKFAYFAGINYARFKKHVVPGDTMKLPVEAEKIRGRVGKFKGEAYVNNELCAEAELVFVLEE